MLPSTTDDDRELLDNTLEWMEGVDKQIGLQHITRRVVQRTMKERSLQGAATVDLPLHLHKYVLLNTN